MVKAAPNALYMGAPLLDRVLDGVISIFVYIYSLIYILNLFSILCSTWRQSYWCAITIMFIVSKYKLCVFGDLNWRAFSFPHILLLHYLVKPIYIISKCLILWNCVHLEEFYSQMFDTSSSDPSMVCHLQCQSRFINTMWCTYAGCHWGAVCCSCLL